MPKRTPSAELSVVIAAGGTGGHIYPGLALAQAVRAVVPQARISFVGTERGLETRLVPEAGYRLDTVDMVPLTREHGLRFPTALARASAQCRRILRDAQADVAVGMGGYSSAPLVVGARLAGIPSVIHDSNAVPGRANRFSARLTSNVALAFEQASQYLPASAQYRTVGMPIVASLAGFDRDALRPQARAALGVPGNAVLVLVNGGSLGATRLNHAAVDLAGRWRHRRDVRLLIKAGAEGATALNQRIAATGAGHVAHAVDYLAQMDTTYAAADVAVGRAGAATVAELGHVGLPSVLVPYPHAPHDHQTRNAQALVDLGAAVLVPDAQVTADHLDVVLGGLVADPLRRAGMAAAALRTRRPDAANRLAHWVMELADHSMSLPPAPVHSSSSH